MADNFDLMATALKAVCPNNEILLDNARHALTGRRNGQHRRPRPPRRQLPCRAIFRLLTCGAAR